jgi:hypothetical protein
MFDRVAAELFGASALQILALLFLRPEAAKALSSCIEGQVFLCRCAAVVEPFLFSKLVAFLCRALNAFIIYGAALGVIREWGGTQL